MIAVKIPLGETVILHGAAVKFVQVLEDSRCPTYITCVWAGLAKVDLEVNYKGKSEKKVIVFNTALPVEENDKIIAITEDCTLLALQLNPYPMMDDEGPLKYVLLVVEEKK